MLHTELCEQYGTDLCACGELVEILGKRSSDFEKEVKRKKKVQDLEKTCRHLEEEV